MRSASGDIYPTYFGLVQPSFQLQPMRRKVDSASAELQLIDISGTGSGCVVPDERLYNDCLVPRSEDQCSKKGNPHRHHRHEGRHAAHSQAWKREHTE